MPKDTLLQVAGSSFAWSGKYAVGAYLHAETRKAYLFDSGPNYKTAEIIDREITNKGYTVTAIIYSHGHLVNINGNSYFRDRYPHLQCYASKISAPIIDNQSFFSPLGPALHSLNMNMGEITDPYISTSIITDTIPYQNDVFEIDDIPFKIHTLPGHYAGMIGIETPDQVFYCADALFGSSTLNKQKLLYFMDPKTAIQTLMKLKTNQARKFVLYHGGIYNTLSKLIEENIKRMDDVSNVVLSLIEKQKQTSESITQSLMNNYELENNEKQYDLAYTITQSFVRMLLNEGQISRTIENGILYYNFKDDII